MTLGPGKPQEPNISQGLAEQTQFYVLGCRNDRGSLRAPSGGSGVWLRTYPSSASPWLTQKWGWGVRSNFCWMNCVSRACKGRVEASVLSPGDSFSPGPLLTSVSPPRVREPGKEGLKPVGPSKGEEKCRQQGPGSKEAGRGPWVSLAPTSGPSRQSRPGATATSPKKEEGCMK